MAIMLVDGNLHKNISEWHSNRSPEVNDPPSDYYEASALPNGAMVITNCYAGTKGYAGGLVSNKRVLPKYNGKLLPYVNLQCTFRFPYAVYQNVARAEFDLKVCIKTRPDPNQQIRNVVNASTQWNRDRKCWQIDQDPPGWVDTGMIVEDIAPDQWHVFEAKCRFDATKFSILSLQLDDQLYEIPAAQRNVPLQNTNWEEIASVQLQQEMYKAGCTLMEVDGCSLYWSETSLA